ncbi:MAG: hypothetical protein HXY53_00180 [Nitrospirae bacterium]|jgi:hypothetical protein|nr:hypothetical protein [Nitrospirota bacterium]
MKKLAKKLEKLFSAIAFAEAGEYDTAREILREEEREQKREIIAPTLRPRKELRAPGIKR